LQQQRENSSSPKKKNIFPAVIKNNLYFLAVLAYASFLVYNYIREGVLFQFSLGVLALIMIPIVLYILHKTKKNNKPEEQQLLFLRQWVPFIIILLSYEALQGIAGQVYAFGDSVSDLYFVDKMFWTIDVTGAIQHAFYSQAMTDVMLFFYTLHFYLVIVASIVLWLFRRALFSRYAIAMTITSYVSLLIFAIYPTAPPWYSGVALNLASSSSSIQAAPPVLGALAHFSSIIESDKFAAFPSLHAAYVTLFCAYMIKLKRKLVLAMIPLEFGVLFATLYLGQHYLIDLVAGVSLALTSVVLAELIARKFKNSSFFRNAMEPSTSQYQEEQQQKEELQQGITTATTNPSPRTSFPS
jgi:membrane-associated phospholipid phosphatase